MASLQKMLLRDLRVSVVNLLHPSLLLQGHARDRCHEKRRPAGRCRADGRADHRLGSAAACDSRAPSAPSSPSSATIARRTRNRSKAARAWRKWCRSSPPTKSPASKCKPEPTVVRAGSLTVGGGTIGVIAGPCSVESEEQILASAKAVKAAGATALRGGAFKPRTSPYSFQGLKEDGLETAGRGPRGDRAGRRHRSGGHRRRRRWSPSMPTCCKSVPATCRTTACWRRSAKRAGRCCSSAARAPRSKSCCWPPNTFSTPAIRNVMLCERGIRTFESHTRFTLPLATVPYLHAQNAPAGGRRSQPRHRATPGSCRRWRRQRRRRRRRADHRSASRPGARAFATAASR